jgi:hypothetical protein
VLGRLQVQGLHLVGRAETTVRGIEHDLLGHYFG